MFFKSDNTTGAAPGLMAALDQISHGFIPSYGDDLITETVKEKFCELFERDVECFLVPTGTIANSLALAHFCSPGSVIFCHKSAHIATDECAAPEFFTSGAKLVTLDSDDGRINPEQLAAQLATWPLGFVHVAQPKIISITNSSELGTSYTPQTITQLSTIAKRYNMVMHMDGARFANCVAHLNLAPADITWRSGIDVLSFGFSKNGALAAEAIIFFYPKQAEGFGYRHKQAGQLLAKTRFVSAQILHLLSQNNWINLAKHANDMAQQLATRLSEIPRIKITNQVEGNIIFVLMPESLIQHLKTSGAQFYIFDHKTSSQGANDSEKLVRLVTSFANTSSDIDSLINTINA